MESERPSSKRKAVGSSPAAGKFHVRVAQLGRGACLRNKLMKVRILPRIPNGDECKPVEHAVFRTAHSGFESRRPFQNYCGHSQGDKGGGLQIRKSPVQIRMPAPNLKPRQQTRDGRKAPLILSLVSLLLLWFVAQSAERFAVDEVVAGSNPVDPPISILEFGLRNADSTFLIRNLKSVICNREGPWQKGVCTSLSMKTMTVRVRSASPK